MDLSPGTRSRPCSFLAGPIVVAGISGSYDIRQARSATRRLDMRTTDGIHSRRVPFSRMTVNGQQAVRLEFTSAVEMLDFVQVVSDHVGRTVGLDDDTIHWVGVA